MVFIGAGWCVQPIRAVRAPEWAAAVHAMIDAGLLDGLRGRTVSRDYLHALVDALAAAADAGTGRNCMPGHEELGELLGRAVKPAKLALIACMRPAAAARAWARICRDRAQAGQQRHRRAEGRPGAGVRRGRPDADLPGKAGALRQRGRSPLRPRRLRPDSPPSPGPHRSGH